MWIRKKPTGNLQRVNKKWINKAEQIAIDLERLEYKFTNNFIYKNYCIRFKTEYDYLSNFKIPNVNQKEFFTKQLLESFSINQLKWNNYFHNAREAIEERSKKLTKKQIDNFLSLIDTIEQKVYEFYEL